MAQYDETILQSRTSQLLVDFIKELWKHADKQVMCSDDNLVNKNTATKMKHFLLEEKYHVIVELAEKAKDKRSISYGRRL